MAETSITVPTRRRGVMRSLVQALRPRQWPKNLLVLAAPAAAGRLLELSVVWTALVAMVAFLLASWAVYLVNDTVDRDADARNPRTADRPLASGDVAPSLALAVAAAAAVGSGVVGMGTGSIDAVAVLVVYMAIGGAYSLGLKRMPLVELMIVAAGYVLRAAMGGIATGVPLSAWFLAVSSFGALWIVTAKRVSEANLPHHREVMEAYPDGLLDQVRSLALTATALTYALWAFETGARAGAGWFHELSVAPFLLALLQYELVARRDGAASPDVVVATDRPLQVIGVVWLVTVGLATHA